jgi:chaperonin GroES
MSNSTYKPLGDRVLVEPEVAEQTTKSGIVIPDSVQEKPQTGKVVRVGEGRVTDEGTVLPVNVKEGDIVIYSKFSGTELKDSGKEYLIIRESDILAIKENN